MADHRATVTVNAPIHQVYELFTHFNDYPKFMTYVKEVTYIDDERSHWVVDVLGRHEWDAVNEGWEPDRRIGWRSVSGVENSGQVTFDQAGSDRTTVTVEVTYTPPAGVFGAVGEALGGGATFEGRLQHDLDHFATMVEQAPPGSLDPTSSTYLFHEESAAARGTTTQAQDQTMGMTSDLTGDDATGATGATAGSFGSERDRIGSAPPPIAGANAADGALNDPTIPVVPGTTINQRDTL